MKRTLAMPLVLALALTFAGCGSGGDDSAPQPPSPADPTLVQTQQGPVKGTAADGVHKFLGIPYAAPPVGPLRWRPPAPPAVHATTLNALQPGTQCLQAGPPPANAPTGAEDCLYLNIYRPASAPGGALPVIVVVHGGGFAVGSALFVDGTTLAKNDNVIVVAMNYRLNALGFLAHPALSADDAISHASGNYGLMDQVAALTWVRSNIAAFGGDPSNVTLTGGSAGGLSVFSHMVSPMSTGLFAKAAPQSGGFSRIQASLPQAEAAGTAFSGPWNCNMGTASDTAACLRALPAATTLSGALPPPLSGNGNLNAWLPNVDGRFLTASTSLAFKAGAFAKVPLLTGFVDDEGTFFVSAAFGQSPLNDNTYLPVGIQGFMGFGDPAVAGSLAMNLYPAAAYPTPNQALARVYGDYRVVCGILQDVDAIAAALPSTAQAYVYQFSEKNPYIAADSLPSRLPPTNSITYGAFHGADVPYWFNQMTGSPTVTQLQLAQAMSSALVRFARTGSPNAAGTFPSWQPYTGSQRSVASFSHTTANSAFDAYTAHQCAFWYGQPPSNRL